MRDCEGQEPLQPGTGGSFGDYLNLIKTWIPSYQLKRHLRDKPKSMSNPISESGMGFDYWKDRGKLPSVFRNWDRRRIQPFDPRWTSKPPSKWKSVWPGKDKSTGISTKMDVFDESGLNGQDDVSFEEGKWYINTEVDSLQSIPTLILIKPAQSVTPSRYLNNGKPRFPDSGIGSSMAVTAVYAWLKGKRVRSLTKVVKLFMVSEGWTIAKKADVQKLLNTRLDESPEQSNDLDLLQWLGYCFKRLGSDKVECGKKAAEKYVAEKGLQAKSKEVR
jgi:hypothetical protein